VNGSPETLGGYVLGAMLGRGGMGAVYRATHPRFPGQEFALKVLLKGDAAGSTAEERFHREMLALARVTAHPGIVRLLASGVDANRPYYVMELVAGESLAARVEREGPLDPRRAAEVVRDVASAVRHAHSCGVLHRDLKPENILLGTDGVTRVCDFGVARILGESRLTRTGAFLGTPAFASPELLEGKAHHVTARSDVWSLGAVLWFALVGSPPFDGATIFALIDQTREGARPPSHVRQGLPAALDTICERSMAPERAHRYPTMALLEKDLERFLDGRPLAPPPARRPWFLLPLAGIAVLVVVAAVLVARRRETKAPGPAASSPDAIAFEERIHGLGPRPRLHRLLELAKEARALAPEALRAVSGKALLELVDTALDEESRPEPSDADKAAVAAFVRDVIGVRLGVDSGDRFARGARALVALDRRDMPTRALGAGRVGGPLSRETLDDLAAWSDEPGESRPAWLLADLLVASGEDARAALEKARRAAPDERAATILDRALSVPTTAEGFAKLLPLIDTAEGPLVLSRFLARCGIPSGLEHPELVARPRDRAAIERVAARTATSYLFRPLQDPKDADVERAAKIEASAVSRGDNILEVDANQIAADRRANVEKNRPSVEALLVPALGRTTEEHGKVLHACGNASFFGPSAAVFEVFESAVDGWADCWLGMANDEGDRKASRTGFGTDWFDESWDPGPDGVAKVEEFDAALSASIARNVVLAGLPSERLPRARLAEDAVRGLRRLEALAETESLDPALRARLVFEALAGLDHFERAGGPGVLPFRARLRLLAFPGAAGEALARLDLARATIVARTTDVERYGFAYFSFLSASAGFDLPAVGAWDQGRDLYGIGVHWGHEHAVKSVGKRGEPGLAESLKNVVTPHAFRVFRGLERWYSAADFEVTAKDRSRLGQPFVLEPAPR